MTPCHAVGTRFQVVDTASKVAGIAFPPALHAVPGGWNGVQTREYRVPETEGSVAQSATATGEWRRREL